MSRDPKSWRVKVRRIDADTARVTYDDSTGRLSSDIVRRVEGVSRFPAYVRRELADWWKDNANEQEVDR